MSKAALYCPIAFVFRTIAVVGQLGISPADSRPQKATSPADSVKLSDAGSAISRCSAIVAVYPRSHRDDNGPMPKRWEDQLTEPTHADANETHHLIHRAIL